MVTITVGKDFGDGLEFVLPQEYLTTVSEFFENSFKGSFLEAKEKKLTLSDVKPVTFRIFVEWLNGRKLLNSEGVEYNGESDGKLEIKRFDELMLLYIFADQYDVPQLRRDVLETFVVYQDDCPTMVDPYLVRLAYDRLPSSSPMLSFLVDAFVFSWAGITPGEKASPPDYPSEFLLSTTSKFCSSRKQIMIVLENSPYESPCDYHEHNGKADEKE